MAKIIQVLMYLNLVTSANPTIPFPSLPGSQKVPPTETPQELVS